MELITKDMIKAKIDIAEVTLSKCFDMLLDMKHARENLGDSIMNFQITLAECLYDLMQFYHQLQAEKKRLILQKRSMDKTTFSTIMKTNADFIEMVKKTIKIGKTMGDAFAWFFYYKSKPALDKHFEHPSTGLFTSGVGGKGEIEFLRDNLNIDGLYVIYHGVTDMLRVGDFSLYANGIGIVGVGELKTKQVNDRLQVTASITSKVKIPRPKGAIEEKIEFSERIAQLKKDFPKLPEQIETQDNLMQAKDSDHGSKHYASHEYNLINLLSPDNPITINEDHSLILIGAWSQYVNLFDILYSDETVKAPESLNEYATQMMEPPSPYNEAIVSEIDLQMHFPRVPILWWNIEDNICRDLYFKKLIISTAFNPAKLIQLFVDEGFTVVSMGRSQDIKLERDKDGKHIEFGSLQAYCDLINQSLMKKEAVFDIAKRIIDDCEAGKFPSGTKIEMHIRQNIFDEMPTE